MFRLSYWFLPLFAGLAWLGTLAGMLGYWLQQGRPRFESMSARQSIPFISDIGAGSLKPLFIAGSTTMVVVFNAALISERWLRHRARLTPNKSRKEAALNIAAIVFSLVGAAGLILLTVFDTRQYPKFHAMMVAVFIGGYILSAIFIAAEYQRLGIHFRQHKILRVSFWIKLAFIFLELSAAIAFGVTQMYASWDVAAILEWILALFFIFYVWSFVIDFLPALRTKRPEDRFPPVMRSHDEDAMKTQEEGNMVGGPVYTNGGHDQDTNGTSQPSRNF